MKAIVTVLVVATVVGSGCARSEWMAPSSPAPAIYYVSSSGDDANDGSTTKPWRTINKVNATTLSPGDTVALEGGAQFHGHLLISQSGTSNLPIQITSYSSASGDRAEISAGAGDGITLRDSEHIRLSNLKITGAGINANNGHGITLRRTMSGSQRLNSIYLDHRDQRISDDGHRDLRRCDRVRWIQRRSYHPFRCVRQWLCRHVDGWLCPP